MGSITIPDKCCCPGNQEVPLCRILCKTMWTIPFIQEIPQRGAEKCVGKWWWGEGCRKGAHRNWRRRCLCLRPLGKWTEKCEELEVTMHGVRDDFKTQSSSGLMQGLGNGAPEGGAQWVPGCEGKFWYPSLSQRSLSKSRKRRASDREGDLWDGAKARIRAQQTASLAGSPRGTDQPNHTETREGDLCI